MAKSSDPNKTSGKANRPIKFLSYPLDESIEVGCRLHFTEYSRFKNKDAYSEADTAIISLPLPVTVPENVNIKTNTVDLGRMGNIGSDIMQALNSPSEERLNDLMKTGYSIVENNLKTGVPIKENLLKAAALSPIKVWGETGENLVQKYAGIVTNPHTTLLFDGVNLRSFTLTWRFSPRSQEESDRLNDILNEIRRLIHPTEFSNGFALNYPDLCHLTFIGPVSKYFPKFRKSMISNLMVNVAGGGMNLYNSGAPIDIEVSITFNELEILTRDIIDKQLAGTDNG